MNPCTYYSIKEAPLKFANFDSPASLMQISLSRTTSKWASIVSGVISPGDEIDRSWYTRERWHESKADILAGWPDGVAMMQGALTAVRRLMPEHAAPIVERMETVWDVAGDDVGVDRFLDCEPECMGTAQTVVVPAQGRVVQISVQGAVSASVSPQSMAKAAAGAMALIDAIEAAGMRCEVSVVWTCAPGKTYEGKFHYRKLISVLLKRAQDPLDMGAIAAGLHPDLYRRWGLRCATDDIVGGESGENIAIASGEFPIPGTVINIGKVCKVEPAEWVPEMLAKVMRDLGIVAA